MDSISYYKNKNVGILGLGVSGLEAAKVLIKSHANIFVFDDKKNISSAPLKTKWLHYQSWSWNEIDTLVVTPGIPINHSNQHEAIKLAKKNKTKIVNDIDLFFQTKPRAKVIGITGTNGKSTTVALLNHILTFNHINSVIGGNFGTPACGIKDPGKKGVIILELSSYQLDGASKLLLNAASIINLTPDHLNYHETFDLYKESKLKILNFLIKDGNFIINKNNNFIKNTLDIKNQNRIKILEVNPDNSKNFIKKNIFLEGKHNCINTAIAIAFAKSLSLNNKQIELAIKTFKGLPHRLEPIYSSKMIKIVNDSKATNGESSSAALKSFKNIFWIAGGEAKSDGIGAALSCLENVLKIFLIGKSSNLFYEQISTVNKVIPVIKCVTLDRALVLAIDKAKNSELDHIVILLSPAAASFDQYINFEERGNKFKSLVKTHYQKKSLTC